MASIERSSAAPPTSKRQRIEIALDRPARLDLIAREAKLDGPVQADRIDRDSVEIAAELGAGAARKADDLRVRNALANRGDNARARLDAPAAKLIGRQHTRPGIENLHGIDAGLELPDQIAGRSFDQKIDQIRKGIRKPIGEQPRRQLIGRSLAGDHVGRHRPRCAAKAEQRQRSPASSALTRPIAS